MKIVQNLFNQIHMFHVLILCIEKTFKTCIYKKMQNVCDIHSFIGSYSIINTFIHVSNVFSTHDIRE